MCSSHGRTLFPQQYKAVVLLSVVVTVAVHRYRRCYCCCRRPKSTVVVAAEVLIVATFMVVITDDGGRPERLPCSAPIPDQYTDRRRLRIPVFGRRAPTGRTDLARASTSGAGVTKVFRLTNRAAAMRKY